ncbi:CDP-3,6-dideoxy-D-glycero-L-glycero-4-hexulose-4-reductase [bacterium]|nr:MinD/ParA family protein [Chloroflexi bacterium CFX6]RIL12744.1 MAG: CDP-3,6-dideoxy-D-glycero-L-glycero-4-hexulose-4-reductase [bacterium]
MARIVSVHSFRGGTGKSNITASLATDVARRGHRVGIVDTDIQSPGIHVLFGMEEQRITHALNDYLWGRCAIEQAAYPVDLEAVAGKLYLIPSSLKTGEIARVLREGYDVTLLNDGFRDLIDRLALDYLFIDTHPGLNEETLLSIAISDVLFIVMRPDRQDYQGTGVTVEVARKLDVPHLYVVVNKVLPSFDFDAVRREVGQTYQAEVIAVLPQCDEMMQLASAGVFVLAYPDHPLTRSLATMADAVVALRD